jgi:hypothetical protein
LPCGIPGSPGLFLWGGICGLDISAELSLIVKIFVNCKKKLQQKPHAGAKIKT